jgi:hypothetical protein
MSGSAWRSPTSAGLGLVEPLVEAAHVGLPVVGSLPVGVGVVDVETEGIP